tara:strand:- start:2803 stop:3564 length:762 start_codon:yes stop_codon:yes gene_type:complete
MRIPAYHPNALVAVVALFVVSLTGAVVADSPKATTAKPREKKIHSAMTPVEDKEGLPRVLLIGDSISVGYTVAVQELLAGKANVHRPLTNCGPTTRGLEALDDWLATGGAEKDWDVIHFNWGLHDLKYISADVKGLADPAAPTSNQQVPPTEYRNNLTQLAKRLQATGASLIWRNTTPVPAGAAGRAVGDSVKYNAIAEEIMAELGISVHDLYSFAKEREATIQLKANVHYSPEGSKVLAEDVVRVINETLSK